jgi:hypothetical protein
METIVLQSDSKENLQQILDLAHRIGVSVNVLSDEELEDVGMVQAIQEGRSGDYVNTEDFLQRLNQ